MSSSRLHLTADGSRTPAPCARSSRGALALLVALSALTTLPLTAQDEGSVTIRGRVVDASTGVPVPGAVVRHSVSGQATVADSTGLFALRVPPAGAYVIRIEQLGYETSQATLPSTAPIEVTTVAIQPRPIELEGLEVSVASQLAKRRVASAREFDAFDRLSLAERGGVGIDMVKRIIPKTRGCFRLDGELCYWRSGRRVTVTLCIDERPAYEGVSELDRYEPADLHSIEVYDGGAHVRVYTNAFMAEMTAEGRSLRPLTWCSS